MTCLEMRSRMIRWGVCVKGGVHSGDAQWIELDGTALPMRDIPLLDDPAAGQRKLILECLSVCNT